MARVYPATARRKRLPTRSVVAEDPPDRLGDGIALAWARAWTRPRAGMLAEIFLNALILLPAPERCVEVDQLPSRVPIFRQPTHAARDLLGEEADAVTMP